ncbi:MAG: SDR family oxidoreductase [Planctomycetes bacterium]|nr:SDR family oxidoreductase [Planctomycetota bacterium]
MPSECWLVTGASGQLGSHLVRLLSERRAAEVLALVGQSPHVRLGVPVHRVDLGDEAALRSFLAKRQPTHILHVGALTGVSDACARPAEAERVNVAATRILAEHATAWGARLVFSSTDMVFDGRSAPYRESDAPRPLSEYGRSKVAAERILANREMALVVRLPLMYGYPGLARETTFTRQISALRAGTPLRLFTDEFRTPLWLADAANALIALADSDLTGVIHVAGPERLTRFEMVARFAELLGINAPPLEPASRLSIEASEPRPEDLSLDAARFTRLFPHLTSGPIRPAVFEDLRL